MGRRFSPDPRDENFLIRRRLATAAEIKLPTRKSWRISPKSLQQDNTGTCVGQGWKNFLRSEPLRTESKKAPSAWDIYRKAVGVDEWSDNDDEAQLPDFDIGLDSGTSVRAGAKAVASLGRLKGYLWAFTLQPALEFLLTQGPLVIGVNWYSSMNRPDDEGIIRISPTARIEGGHCVEIRTGDLSRGLAGGPNSWGDGWGVSGNFWIPLRDLERLIAEDGEVCTAIERKLEPLSVAPPKPPTTNVNVAA